MNKGLLMAGLLCMGVGCSHLHGEDKDDEKMDLSAAPAPVQDAIKKVAGDAKIDKIEKEDEDGKTVFEAKYKVGDAKHTVSVSRTGEVLEEETAIAVSDLPAKISDAIKAKYPNAKIEKAELTKAVGKTSYEVDVEAANDEDHEIVADASGSILSDKVEKEHEDGEKGEKKGEDKEEKGEH